MFLDGFVDERLQLRFAHGAGYLINNFAALKEDECRNGADAKSSWGSGVVVHIHFGYNDFAVKFGGQLINNRTNCFAGATPWCPEVDQAGESVADYLGVEFAVRYMQYLITCHLHLSC